MTGEAKPNTGRETVKNKTGNTLRNKRKHREETDVNKTDSGDKTQQHD